MKRTKTNKKRQGLSFILKVGSKISRFVEAAVGVVVVGGGGDAAVGHRRLGRADGKDGDGRSSEVTETSEDSPGTGTGSTYG